MLGFWCACVEPGPGTRVAILYCRDLTTARWCCGGTWVELGVEGAAAGFRASELLEWARCGSVKVHRGQVAWNAPAAYKRGGKTTHRRQRRGGARGVGCGRVSPGFWLHRSTPRVPAEIPRGSVGSGRHWWRANTSAQRLTRGAAAERRGLLGLVVAARVLREEDRGRPRAV